MSKLLRFARSESGATMVEYGLIAAGIAVALITVITQTGTSLNGVFDLARAGLQ